MSWDLVQHAAVTLAALGAGGVILREVAGFLRPGKQGPSCGQCAAGPRAGAGRQQAGVGRNGEPALLQITRKN